MSDIALIDYGKNPDRRKDIPAGGPWDDEPDKVQWIDAETDLDCLIVRGPSGALCGYVGVTSKHPWHEIDYMSCSKGEDCDADQSKGRWCNHSPESQIEVHGAITFAGACMEDHGEFGICHKPQPGRPSNVWWFGFDCAHLGDLSPAYIEYRSSIGRSATSGDVYRNFRYVKDQVRQMAAQLKAVA